MKNLIYVIVLLFPFLLSFTNNETNEKKIRVVIDAGHGGEDNGAIYNNYTEKEITEAVARKIKFLNRNKAIEIIVVRDKDEFISLNDRVSKINILNPDLVISLHVNSNTDTTTNGFEVYTGEKNANTDLSKEIAESMYDATPKSLSKRNIKEANFYILNNVNCPAVMLELGFLTNSNDRNYLTSQIGQQRLAEMILRNIDLK